MKTTQKTTQIPTVYLNKSQEPISFDIRTMQGIDELNKGKSPKPHRHHYYTVLWAWQASGTHFIDFQAYPITNNSLFFVSPHQVHQVLTDPKPTGVVILFTPEFLEMNGIREEFISNLRLFRACNDNPPLLLEDEKSQKLAFYCQEMQQLYKQKNDYQQESLGAFLKLFLIECHQHHKQENNPQRLFAGQQILKNFRDLVEKNYKNWHQVQEYAQALHVTAGHLNDTLKLFMGCSAKDYIQERIVLEAKRMAFFTESNAKEIAYELGFEDPNHFNKFFKKIAHISLKDFRAKEQTL